MTDPAKWTFIESVFFDALDISSEERESFVHAKCGDDAASAEEVLSLLAAHFDGPPLIDGSLLTFGLNILAENAGDGAPARVGRYGVTRELGRGGMANVYLAEREEGDFQHRVAVKVMRTGLDSRSLVARFVTERQVLATLDHPNIARLYDGGVTERGQPYIVMEYVDGVPLLEYCRNRLPELEDRLRLFTKVCDAVQHAHRNLIVHRDLKPGNILVMADGTPKLLDFGIAKIFRDDFKNTLAQTAAEDRLLTPAYASPEQIRGKNITTATDVYSLGVIFYELLSGDSPYSNSRDSYDELIAAICDHEPVRPSAAVEKTADEEIPEVERRRRKKRVSGDLDIIALKALAKDPARRYASVDQMAEDIRRHLDGRPISARPDTVRYRVAKFVQRNRWQTAAAILVMASMLGGTGVALWQARKTELEREKALQSQKKAKDRANAIRILCSDFTRIHDEIKNIPGATEARKLVLELGVQNLDRLAEDSLNDPDFILELAKYYKQFGDLQGRTDHGNLGKTVSALQSYEKAQIQLENAIELNPKNIEVKIEIIEVSLRESITFQRRGEYLKAFEKLNEAGFFLSSLNKKEVKERRLRGLFRTICRRKTSLLMASGAFDYASRQAVQLVEESKKNMTLEDSFESKNNFIEDVLLLAATYFSLAEKFYDYSPFFYKQEIFFRQKAVFQYEEILRLIVKLIDESKGKEKEALINLREVVELYRLDNGGSLGDKQVVGFFLKNLRSLKQRHENDKTNIESRFEYQFFRNRFAILCLKNGKTGFARRLFEDLIGEFSEMVLADQGNETFLQAKAEVLFYLASTLVILGKKEAATRKFLESLEISGQILLSKPGFISSSSRFFFLAIKNIKKIDFADFKTREKVNEISEKSYNTIRASFLKADNTLLGVEVFILLEVFLNKKTLDASLLKNQVRDKDRFLSNEYLVKYIFPFIISER